MQGVARQASPAVRVSRASATASRNPLWILWGRFRVMRLSTRGPRGTVLSENEASLDGLGRGLLFDLLTDDTDDTKSSIPDIKRIPTRDKMAGVERPPSV